MKGKVLLINDLPGYGYLLILSWEMTESFIMEFLRNMSLV